MQRCRSIRVEGRELRVLLPASYEQDSKRRFPVAYVQDGGDLFTGSVNYLRHLTAVGELPELILAGVVPKGRTDEYTPWPSGPLKEGTVSFGGGARAYTDELADVLKPYMDRQFRTLPEAGRTAVIGGSLGGLAALFAAIYRPDSFGLLGLLSASFWYENVLEYLRGQAHPPRQTRIFMSVGSCEGIYKNNVQRDMVGSTAAVRSLWLEQGVSPSRLKFSLEEGATHDHLFMAGQFPAALKWLFGGGAEQPVRPGASADSGRPATSGASAEGSGRSATSEEPADSGEPESLEESANPGEAAGFGEPVNLEQADEGNARFFQQSRPFTLPGAHEFTMTARRSGLMYRIFAAVSNPGGPAPSGGYPVLYALDGNAVFGSLVEATRVQCRGPRGYGPLLVVGIGYDSDVPFATERRFFDFTEPADSRMQPARPDGSPWPQTGGAEAFLDFIEAELKPEIERLFPVDRSRQTLFGHSLGGLFALNVLFAKPQAFRTYIAGSPSIWWNGRELLKEWPLLEAKLRRGAVDAELLIGVGMEEKTHMIEDAEELHKLLSAYNGRGLRADFRRFAGEGHVSVIPPLISAALRFMLSGTLS